MSYPDNATASIAQFLFRDSAGAMYIIPRRAFHNGSQYGDTVTIVQDLSGNGNDLTGTGAFARRPFYGGPSETMNNVRDGQYIGNPSMIAPVGNLGDDCTIIRAMPGIDLEIEDEQSVTSDYVVANDFSLMIIIDRQLTESEIRVISDLASRWCGAVDHNVPPALIAMPVISGNYGAGLTLTCSEGEWFNADSVEFQWLADGQPIAGETSDTLDLTVDYVGQQINCRVTATNAAGSRALVTIGEVVVFDIDFVSIYENELYVRYM